jgi:Uma2 family endonuclease
MAHAVHHRFSFHDYVTLEEDSGIKHEFLGGQVWAMSGGSPAHAAIAANITALLTVALGDKPCQTFSSDLRVRVQATGLATYPDVSVGCGKLELDPEDPKKHTALNPKLIVEVLSPSTEDYDRGEKLGHYKQIPSVAEVVLVAHDRREIEVVRREADGSWSRTVVGEGASAQLLSVGCALPVDEVYRNPLAAT